MHADRQGQAFAGMQSGRTCEQVGMPDETIGFQTLNAVGRNMGWGTRTVCKERLASPGHQSWGARMLCSFDPGIAALQIGLLPLVPISNQVCCCRLDQMLLHASLGASQAERKGAPLHETPGYIGLFWVMRKGTP